MSSGIRQALIYVILVATAGVLAFVVIYTLASGSSQPAPVVESRLLVTTPTSAPPTPTAFPLTATPAPTPTSAPTAIPPIVLPSPTPEPTASVTPEKDPVVSGLVVVPPDLSRTRGRWIDLNLSDGITRLMDGHTVVKEMPSAWGYGTPGAADDYYSTPPDLYFIYEKRDELHYDETFATGFFRGWVGFDPERANGFHSFILDRQEKIIDDRPGPVSHGCIRVEDWRTLYDFAQVGMPVMIHNGLKGTVNSTPHD